MSNIAATSILAFHTLTAKQRQFDMILSAMELTKDYSFRELTELTGVLPSTISARVNEMRDDFKVIERSDKRKCSVTGRLVVPHRINLQAMT